MTKKDYIKLAQSLRDARECALAKFDAEDELVSSVIDATIESVVSQMIYVFRADNARFDSGRFRNYVTSHCVVCNGPIDSDKDVCSHCVGRK